uniref:Uncharacterized protein n=1 Tax=Plectus sambesii TaxID=2011161 RepID=A0A914UUU4_9BILA
AATNRAAPSLPVRPWPISVLDKATKQPIRHRSNGCFFLGSSGVNIKPRLVAHAHTHRQLSVARRSASERATGPTPNCAVRDLYAIRRQARRDKTHRPVCVRVVVAGSPVARRMRVIAERVARSLDDNFRAHPRFRAKNSTSTLTQTLTRTLTCTWGSMAVGQTVEVTDEVTNEATAERYIGRSVAA